MLPDVDPGVPSAPRESCSRWIALLVTALFAAVGMLSPGALAQEQETETHVDPDDPDIVTADDEPMFLDEEGALEERVTALEEELRRLREGGAGAGSREAPSEPRPGGLEVTFRDGLVFRDPDRKRFWFRIGGQVAQDWVFFAEDRRVEAQFGNFQDGTDFRTARFALSGFVPAATPPGVELDEKRGIAFRAEYDFAPADGEIRDLFVELRGLPIIDNLGAGHFIEPFGLESVTRSKYATFVERSLTSILTPGRNAGVLWSKNSDDKTQSYALGFFRETDERGRGLEDGESIFTGRATWAPLFANDGRQVAHLGLAYRFARPPDSMVRFSGTPEVDLAPTVVDTGPIIGVDRTHSVGLEGAVILGPLSAQGEYVLVAVERNRGDDALLQAGYVTVSYFLTGECRRYQNGRFGRVYPKTSIFEIGSGPREEDRVPGFGAWELAARWSTIDLDDGDVQGGDIDHEVTLGLNGYLNANTRLFFDYVNSQLDEGTAHAFVFRLQFDF